MRCARREAGPPEPAAAPRGRARKLLSLLSASTGGHGAAPADSHGAASLWRRLALLPVLALLLGMFSPFAAAPASAAVLVSNVGQATFTPTITIGTNPVAQKFTTGSTTAGYTLESLEIEFAVAVGTPANLRVELWSATSGGAPDSKLAGLTVPSTVGVGAVAFDAPSNTSLDASASYFMVVYRSGTTTGSLRTTRTNNEDTGSASGWSIGDTRHGRSGTSWVTNTIELKIRVNGAVKGATRSTNSALSGLTTKSATSATGTFSTLFVGTFDKNVLSYSASVTNATTHVKLTPTVEDTGKATVKVGKGTSLTAVNSGSESSAIALSVGSNAIKVEVTAQDGTTKRTYTVTVTRAGPAVQFENAAYRLAEASSDLWPAEVHLTIAGAGVSEDTRVNISIVAGGTATGRVGAQCAAGDDFRLGQGFVDVNEGPTRFNLWMLHNCDDSVDEPRERFTLRIEPGAGYTVGTRSTTVVTIEDNDATTGTGVWSATLTPRTINNGPIGCNNTASGNNKCSDTTTLSDDDFTYKGVSHTISVLTRDANNELSLWFTGNLSAAAKRDLVLVVGNKEFHLADFGGSGQAFGFRNAGLTWNPGTPVSLSLKLSATAQSTSTQLSFASSTYSVDEGASVTLTVNISPVLTAASRVTVHAATPQSADNPDDYTLSGVSGSQGSRVLALPANASTATFTLAAVADTATEGDEIITWLLLHIDGEPYSVPSGSGKTTVTIADTSTATGTTPTTSTAVWEATLTVKDIGGSFFGCQTGAPNVECSTTSVLTDDDFTISGTDWAIAIIVRKSNFLRFKFDRDVRTALDSYNLCVGTTAFAFSSASHSFGNTFAQWTTTAASWSVGDTVSLKIAESCTASTATGPGDAGLTAGLVVSVEPGDGSLALTWNKPWGPNTAYEVNWKASTAPDADATTPGDPSTGWVAPRVLLNGSTWETKYLFREEYTVGGLVNGTAYDVRVRQFSGGETGRWATGAGTPAAPAPPAALTLSVDPVALAHGGAVTVTARLDAPAQKAMDVWFDTAGDGGAARWGPDCAWEHGTADMVAAGEREATVKLCATAAGAGRTMTVTAGSHDPALAAAGVKVRVQGPNPPTALVVEADPQAVAAGGTVPVTVRVDRPSAPGMTVHLSLNGVGAASWGACGGTAAARTLPSPLSGYRRVEIPPGGREATAELCVLRGGGPRLELGAYSYAPRLDAPDLALPGPGGLDLRALTVTSPNPEQRVAQGEVALEEQRSSYELRVPLAVERVTVKPAVKYASAAVKVNGKPVDAGTPAVDVPLKEGENPVIIEVSVPKVTAVRKYTLTVVRSDAAKEAETRVLARPACEAGAGPLCGLALTAGSGAVELSPAFAPGVTFYRASVPAGTAGVTLAPRWGGEASVFAGSRWGATTFTRPARVRPSGTAVALALAPNGGTTELWVMASGGPGGRKTYRIDVTEMPAAVAVSLSATPNPVAEGSPVTVTAVLAKALAADVTIPLTVTRGTSEDGDHGTLASVTVPAGGTSASGAIATSDDADGDDETFTVALGSLPSGLAAGAASSVEVTITDDGAQQQRAEPLTASFEAVPLEHDGSKAFWLKVRFSEALGEGAVAPSPASFRVRAGQARKVERIEAGLWRVKVRPDAWHDVTVTLAPPAGCTDEGAVCASGGRALANAPGARVGGPVRIRVGNARGKEGKDERLDFAVTLSRAASGEVSVDYATADGTATAGEDYEATSGTLTFAPGETAHTVRVAILDDAVDEGKETFVLKLSNPQGAYLRGIHREAKGVITNADALQKAWLARFGRTVGTQVTDAVTGRLADGLAPGAHATLAGQALDLSNAEDGKALADAMTGLARAFGASEAPDDDGPLAGHGLGGGWDAPAATTAARSMTTRELLLGSAFHVAPARDGAGPGLAAWGRVADGRFDGEAASDTGSLRLDGEVLTGTLGADAEWERLLAGVAVSLSEGAGTFDNPGVDSGAVESTMTTVSPYLRLKLTERVSAWGLAGWGTGAMTMTQDAIARDVNESADTGPARAGKVTKTDLSMRLGALGARGALMEQDEAGGMDLALKADAFFVRTEWERVSGETDTAADASRVRLVLEGGRAFDLGEGATLRPSLELGVRHDGGDAETGAGLELGGGLSWTDPATGLSLEARARMLAAHADSDYEEWGASVSARLDPGERGRGLSFSLSPTLGASSSATERLWGAHDARGLAPGGGEFEASRSLQGEMGYGVALFGGRFTGTPNAGFGLSDGGARDYRIGWRLNPAAPGDPGFEVNLDATRSEPAGGSDADHALMLRSLIRW